MTGVLFAFAFPRLYYVIIIFNIPKRDRTTITILHEKIASVTDFVYRK